MLGNGFLILVSVALTSLPEALPIAVWLAVTYADHTMYAVLLRMKEKDTVEKLAAVQELVCNMEGTIIRDQIVYGETRTALRLARQAGINIRPVTSESIEEARANGIKAGFFTEEEAYFAVMEGPAFYEKV